MTKEDQVSYNFQNVVSQKTRTVIGGKGVRINVKDPKTGEVSELFDGVTGAAVGALGWGDKAAIDIIKEAAEVATYSYPVNMTNDYSEDLAKYYIDRSPKGAFASALFVGSGSEANENAMKIIRQYHMEKKNMKKVKFISRQTSYHGFSIGTLSLGDNPKARMFQEILLPESQTLKAPPCYPYREQKKGETLEQYGQRLVDEMEQLILKEDPDTIAGMFIEPLPGSVLGTVPPPKNYLKGLRDLCNKYDIILHFDEVMCGTGRVSPNGGLNCWENFLGPEDGPDLQTIGKTLGSGYVTVAGILVSPKIMKAFNEGSGFLGGAHTYSGHGFNCLVALKIQQRIEELKLTENIFKVGNYMGEKLKEETKDSKIVGSVRGLGGFWSVEFVKDKQTKESFPVSDKLNAKIQEACYKNGLSIMSNQGCNYGAGDLALFAPSFVVTESDIDDMVAIFKKSLAEVEQTLNV